MQTPSETPIQPAPPSERFGALLDQIQAYAKLHGLDRLTETEIEAEISAVRAERRNIRTQPDTSDIGSDRS